MGLMVFLTVFNRLESLTISLRELDSQIFKDFSVTILDNSFDKDRVEKIVRDFKGNLDVRVKKSAFNAGPMIRFVEARDCGSDYVVFLDDDESLKPDTLAVFNEEKEPNTLKAVFASNFDADFTRRKKVTKGSAKYVGPGGMVADASIFRMESFWKEWKPEYYVIDDCWLSYFAEKIGWRKEASQAPLILKRSEETSMLKNKTIQWLKQSFVDTYNWKDRVGKSWYVKWNLSQNGKWIDDVGKRYDVSVITDIEYDSLINKDGYSRHWAGERFTELAGLRLFR